MKYFRMSYDEVVFKRSYLNLILLNCAIPSYKPFKEEDEGDEDDSEDFNVEKELERLSLQEDKRTKKNKAMHAGNFFMNFM